MKPVKTMLCAATMLAACAGRAPAPVAVSQMQDHTMSCNAIQAEIAANKDRIAELGTEKGLKVAQNVGAGVLGFFTLGIGWALMDAQGAAGTDQQSLEKRNAYLGQLSLEKCATG